MPAGIPAWQPRKAAPPQRRDTPAVFHDLSWAARQGNRPKKEKCTKYWRCILYIVRRTQLYLDDHLWDALHARARSRQTTISELVREAVRERYLGNLEERAKAMQDLVGIRKGRSPMTKAVEEVRQLRRGGRLESMREK